MNVECLFLFIVGAAIVAAIAIKAAKQYAELTDAYSRLAKHYGGECTSGGWFSKPWARFFHAGSWVTVEIYSTGGKNPTYYTQARFQWQETHFRCEVYPERIWARVGKLMGMEDIEIGSPDFDQTYIITSNDRTALCRLLNSSVQLQIERLRFFLGNNDIYVSFSHGRLLVKKLSRIRSFHRLQQFVQLAIDLYDQAALTLEQGIEFVAQAEPPKASEVICQICGEPVTSQVVFCRRCKTPHHLDCWEYYGACSTYGCGERRYLFPKPKRGKKPAKDTDGSSRTPKVPFDRHTRRGV